VVVRSRLLVAGSSVEPMPAICEDWGVTRGSPPTVLLTRHGQTEWNLAGRRQGQLDSPLTEQGIRDAAQVADAAKAYPVDIIVTSPLGRARQTASIVNRVLGVGVVELSDLAEINHGSFAGFTDEELDNLHPGWRAERLGNLFDWCFPGGESYRDGWLRAQRALDSPPLKGATCPLIVTHEMIGRMVIGLIDRLSPDQALAQSSPHGSIRVLHPRQ